MHKPESIWEMANKKQEPKEKNRSSDDAIEGQESIWEITNQKQKPRTVGQNAALKNGQCWEATLKI